MLDSSSSIRETNPSDGSYDNYRLLLQFVARIIDSLDIGHDRTRVGLVSYSDIAENIFFLNRFYSKQDLIDAVYNIEYKGSSTNTSGAIREMHYTQFSEQNGNRPNVQDIAIVILGGTATVDQNRLLPNSMAAQISGIRMLSVGITGVAGMPFWRSSDLTIFDELQMISAPPQTEGVTYWTSTDFTMLDDLVDDVERGSCIKAVVPCK